MPVTHLHVINSKFLRINFRNPLLYFLLCVKLFTVIILNFFSEANFSTHWSENTLLAYYSGDSHAYIDPIDNFIETGTYFFDEGNGKVYNGRAPYYGSIYFILRQVAGNYLALDLLAFLQILIDCFAGLVMSVLIFRMTSASWAFWLTLIFYTGSFYQTDYAG